MEQKDIQLRIEILKNRVKDIKNSNFFSEKEKSEALKRNKDKINYFKQELSKNKEVINPEIL
jgi:hypothetical protein